MKQITYPYTLKNFRNESLYLLCDTNSEKDIIINLSQTGRTESQDNCLKENKMKESKLESEINEECGLCLNMLLNRVKCYESRKLSETDGTTEEECLPVFLDREQPFATLVMGTMLWYSDKQDENLISLCTLGSKGIVLTIPPGRCIFRAWVGTDTPYVVQLISNSSFVIGSWEDALAYMTEESISFRAKCREFGEHFDALLKSFGKSEFENELQLFWKSYRPPCEVEKMYSNIIHDVFYKELFTMVERAVADDVNCLRVLLMQWQFPYALKESISNLNLCYNVQEDEMEFLELMFKSVTKIQAFFKGFYERLMMRLHSSDNKRHRKILEGLKRIGNELLPGEKKVENSIILFRSFFNNEAMEKLRILYDYYQDVRESVTRYDFSGFVKLSEKDCTFICRQIFYVNFQSPIKIRICLFCDLFRIVVRVFDNDTRTECHRYTDNVSIGIYKPNINGYVVLCYGWSNVSKSVNYKLSLIVEKNYVDNMLTFSSATTKTETFKSTYIPNINNRICRYLLSLMSEQVLLSIFFSTSLKTVELFLKISEVGGTVILTVHGQGVVIIPALFLYNSEISSKGKSVYGDSFKTKKSSKKSIRKQSLTGNIQVGTYVLEVFVINNSWPLNLTEWNSVDKAKCEHLCFSNVSVRSDPARSKKKYTMSEIPFSSLEIILGANDVLNCMQDKRRELEIREMKTLWIEPDRYRHEKSVQYREEYLKKHVIENPQPISPGQRCLFQKYFQPTILPFADFRNFIQNENTQRKFISPEILQDMYAEERDVIEQNTLQCEKSLIEVDASVKTQRSILNNLKKSFVEYREESETILTNAILSKQQYIKNALLESEDRKPILRDRPDGNRL